jgi:hypothetical protein
MNSYIATRLCVLSVPEEGARVQFGQKYIPSNILTAAARCAGAVEVPVFKCTFAVEGEVVTAIQAAALASGVCISAWPGPNGDRPGDRPI